MYDQPQINRTFTGLLEAKKQKVAGGVTFEQIGKQIGMDEVWVAAVLYGQAKATNEQLETISKYLGVEHTQVIEDVGGNWFPNRGIGPIPPTDPVVYRLYEAILVYGHPLKAVIHEKFGDGIMSAIDCQVHVDRKPDPKGDRIVLTFDGKYLPYSKW